MVMPGYKQTEIGVLPDSWDTITFEECFTILPNNALSRAELNYNGGEVQNIHYGDILVKFPAVLDCSTEGLPYINKENVSKASKGFLRDGDLIMADTAEDVIVGKSTEVIGIGDSKIVSGLHTIPCRPRDAEMFAPKWLGYFINHCTYHDQLIPYITGIKVSSVSKSAISSTVIAVPPKPEQEAIAEALTDIDTLIVNLEKLIAKKKAIKQGAMITLLRKYHTDKKSVKLKDLCAITTGKMDANAASESGKYKFFTCAREDSRIDEFAFEGDAILIAGNGDVGHSKLYSGRFNAYQRTYVLMDFMVSPYLLKQYIDYKLPKAILTDLQGGAMPYIKISTLAELTFDIPVSLEEQKHIETTLYDMGTEIDILERNLEKYRSVKQGMMSELLTGRIRLIDKEEV